VKRSVGREASGTEPHEAAVAASAATSMRTAVRATLTEGPLQVRPRSARAGTVLSGNSEKMAPPPSSACLENLDNTARGPGPPARLSAPAAG
jgi:hypothetical protein